MRKAIAHGINRQVLIKAQGGFPEPIKSPVVPVFDFYDPNTPDYAYDVEKAKKILDDAGYKAGSDGIREKDGEKLSYSFVIQAGRADDELAQQVIIAQLKAIGIEAKADNKTALLSVMHATRAGMTFSIAAGLPPRIPSTPSSGERAVPIMASPIPTRRSTRPSRSLKPLSIRRFERQRLPSSKRSSRRICRPFR